MEQIYKRLGNLLSIKSLVTLVLTAVFAYLTCSGGVTADQFLTVFTVVIAFYFGTQAEKNANKNTCQHKHTYFLQIERRKQHETA